MVEKSHSSRPPLLLVHGFRGSPKGLEEIASFLKTAGYPVFLPEIPPTGKNNSLPDYSPESYSNFLKNYLSVNEINQPILVGHSMGSIICAAFAEKNPDLINKKLILLSPIVSKVSKPLASLSSLITILPNRPIDHITFNYLYVGKGKERSVRKKAWSLSKTKKSDFSSNRDLKASAKFSSSFSIADFNFKKDCLFILGDKDRLVSLKKLAPVANKLNAKVKIIKNSGHIMTYENPKLIAEKIRQFIEA